MTKSLARMAFAVGLLAFLLLLCDCPFAADVPISVQRQKHDIVFTFRWPGKITATSKNNLIFFEFNKPAHINYAKLKKTLPAECKLISIPNPVGPASFHLRCSAPYQVKTVSEKNQWVVRLTPPKKDLMKGHILVTGINERDVKKLFIEGPSEIAAFKRGTRLWVVWPSRSSLVIKPSINAIGISSLIKNEAEGWFCVELAEKTDFAIHQKKNHWEIDFKKEDIPHPLSILFRAGKFGRKEAEIRATNPAKIVTIKDPITKDKLWVIPLHKAGESYPDDKKFVQFSLIPTVQGIVLLPHASDLKTRLSSKGVTLFSQKGLLVSDSPQHSSHSKSKIFPSLLKFKSWEPPMAEAHDHLRKMVQETQGGIKIQASLDLARFYLESGMETEAIALLSQLKNDNPEIEKEKDFLALYAVSQIIERHFQEAARILDLLNQESEMQVWRGVLEAMQGRWDRADFRFIHSFVPGYPDPMRNKVSLIAAETYAVKGEQEKAKALLDLLDKDSLSRSQYGYWQYIQGLMADYPRPFFEKGLAEGDPSVQAKAGLALVEIDLKSPAPNIRALISTLERLKYLWRGTYVEVDIVTRLSDLYMRIQNYPEAFRALGKLKLNNKNAIVDQKILNSLKELILNPSPHIDPITLLSLYEENKILFETASDHLKIQKEIIKRYCDLGLFNHAVETLGTMKLKNRPWAQRAWLYTKDSKPHLAIKELNSIIPKNRLEKERQALLLANAYLTLHDTPQALSILQPFTTANTHQLRALIYRKEKNWTLAGEFFVKAMEMEENSNLQLNHLLNAVVCYAIADDHRSLAQLMQKYSSLMEGSKHRDAFKVLLIEKNLDPHLAQFFKTYQSSLKDLIETEDISWTD